MDTARLSELLTPFTGTEELSADAVGQLKNYLDLLLRWNARMSLTAVRDPESIVTRHFGESIFAARMLFPAVDASETVIDVGSGAGFPGLPMAIVRPGLQVTLLEAHGKKATFLREAIRSTEAKNARVIVERAETYSGAADVVTLRAVEEFSSILPVSARIVAGSGRLGALIGASQVADAVRLIGDNWWSDELVYFPGSTQRTLWIARRVQAKS